MSLRSAKATPDPEADRCAELQPVNRLIRAAVLIGLIGLIGLSLFLIFDFLPWIVGLGIFIGIPLINLP